MLATHAIATYAQSEGRNHIVFCPHLIDGLQYHNVGKEVAEALRKTSSQFDAYSIVMTLFAEPECDGAIGKYIALQNINILFEAELMLDFSQVLDTLSRESCLIIATDAVIAQDKLHFEGMNEPSVDLRGLSYLEIV